MIGISSIGAPVLFAMTTNDPAVKLVSVTRPALTEVSVKAWPINYAGRVRLSFIV